MEECMNQNRSIGGWLDLNNAGMKGGICRRWVVWMGGWIDVGISECYDGRMDGCWMDHCWVESVDGQVWVEEAV